MTTKEHDNYIHKNISKYVTFLIVRKYIEYFIDPTIKINPYTKHSRITEETKFYIKNSRHNMIKIINMICEIYKMYENMNEIDEEILNLKKEDIMKLINNLINNYVTDKIILKKKSRVNSLRYLQSKGVIQKTSSRKKLVNES